MAQRIGSMVGIRVVVGMALVAVAAYGMTQPGLGAGPAAGLPQEPLPTACPVAPDVPAGAGEQMLPQDPCEPDPCGLDSDGDGVGNRCDPCPTDPTDTCDDPTPTTTAPTDPPTTSSPPTTAPPTTAPPTTSTPTSSPTSTPAPAPVFYPGCTSGCVYERSVGLRVKGKHLRGAVTSPAVGCRSGATVTVWRAKKGADRRQVVLPTRRNGTFRTTRPARPGRYYVTVTSPDQPLCGDARSRKIRIRKH